MDENKKEAAVQAPEERDQELFAAIGKDRKKKRRRTWITVIVIVALVAAGLTAAVIYGQRKVRDQMGNMNSGSSQVVSYTVDTGSVNTTVTGSGLLADVDTEKLSLPEGVKVDKLLVAAGDRVEEGDLLCTVELSSVLGALADTQQKITDLDAKLRTAAYDTAANTITAGVNARVKRLYAAVGDDVAACMYENGALALLSLDGYMALELETDALAEEDEVTVVRPDGKELKGTVESVMLGKAVILVTDDGPELDETVTVRTPDGEELGTGTLYIHNPLRVTGYAGTVNAIYTGENRQVWAGNALFVLKDTAYSANYESILRQRREEEETLLQLMGLYRAGAYEAPFTGSVASVEYKDPNAPSADTDPGSTNTDMYGNETYEPYYGGMNVTGTVGASGTDNTGNAGAETSKETALLTLSPDERMTVTITVDEMDILALEVGQEAQITINSIGDIFFGEVSEVNRNASANAGVTNYTAVISMPKDERMLPGMSAKAVVRIQGVENTILIPESALHQTRDAAFVYTSYDPETKELGGAVPVIAGLSNGNMVEIVEGLSEGDTVWYMEVWDPWSYYAYGTGGDATGGDAWVEISVSDGDGMVYEEIATDGDAG